MSKKRNEFDIIVGYNTSFYPTIKLMSFCYKNEKKFITDTDEWYSPDDLPGGRYALPCWINELNMRIIHKKVKNKILISNFLNKYYSKSIRITIPPLIDSEDTKWKKNSKILEPFVGVRIIYAGSPGKKKDLLDVMLKAVVDSVKDGLHIQFVILGISIDEVSHYSCFNEIVNMSKNIVFCGKQPQEVIPTYYHQSHFSMLIRKKTRKNTAGFPTKFVESMMSGCPVIFNETSDMLDYITDGVNGIVVKDTSVEEIKKSLQRVCAFSDEDLMRMKDQTKKTAIEKFDYRNYLLEMETFMAKLV